MDSRCVIIDDVGAKVCQQQDCANHKATASDISPPGVADSADLIGGMYVESELRIHSEALAA